MAVETEKWGIVYCPKAGITNKRKRWEKIQKVLDERQVNYDFVQSETSDSVERLMKMMISNGYKTIIIVGGDSALNDAVNCLMMEEKEVISGSLMRIRWSRPLTGLSNIVFVR